MTLLERYYDLKWRDTGTFLYQWKQETHNYSLVPKSYESEAL